MGGKEEYLQKINFETEQKLAEMNNRVQQKEQLVINDLVAQVSHRPLWVILYDSSFISNHSKITHLGCEYCSTIAPKLCCWSIN